MPRTPRAPKKGKGVATGNPTERPAWPDRFLTALKDKGTVSGAALVVKVGRRTVYDEMARNPEFAQDVRSIQEECVELVEATLYEQALDPDKTTDRIFYLKTARPEKYGDKLRADQIELLKRETREQLVRELDEEISRLPAEVQASIFAAMRRINPAQLEVRTR